MSRLIVKNLPKSVNDAKIKELFSKKGTVTDVQLKYTEDGKFRRFGFIGFKTEEEAAAAIEFFNNTCINTSRITVEYCAGLGDSSKPKSWSKYAPDSKAKEAIKEPVEQAKSKKETRKAKVTTEEIENKEKNDKKKTKITSEEVKDDEKKEKKKKKDKDKENSKIKELLAKHKDDPLFNEFLESHTKGDSKVWTNDALQSLNEKDEDSDEDKNSEEGDSDESESDAESKKDLAKKNISDKEYMEALKKSKSTKSKDISETNKTHGPNKYFTVKMRGLAYNHKKKDIKQFFKGIKGLKSVRVPQKIKGIAYVGFKTEKQMKLALNKNKSFLDGKRIFVSKYEEVDKNDKKDETKNSNLRWKHQEDALKNEENIAESGRIFLRNLAYIVTEDDIRKIFEKYGPLTEVNLPIDKTTRKPKGFGTVTFLMPEHAVKAYTELDGSIQNGRMLHLLPAKSKTSLEDLLSQDGLTFKQKKELKEKALAGSSHNWNTLFLGQNAVADAIANAYNTTKENVLQDGEGTSVAVRLALGETQLVQETQKFLEENGVHLNAFNQTPNKRSKTVILVKNLPARTKVEEIRELFEKHGVLGRVILPPSGITALVEYLEPSEARKGFMRLAYSKFKHLPLYLEWAPDDSFTSPPPKPSEMKNEKKEASNDKSEKKGDKNSNIVKTEEKSAKDENKISEDEDEDEDEPEADTTLFVKNLNFSTTEEQLKKHFSKCGRLHYANITTKKDPKNPGNKLSMGYGFVRYKFKLDAERALKELQMSDLDGKSLDLKRSERTLQSDVATAKKSTKITEQTGTKILVRNVPFQANADEVKDLFKAFGELKGVRLPKKMVGDEKHRGFGFVEFYTKKEAKRAFKALCQSTHLYGRRLVLEWAQSQEGIEDLRKRTAKHFHEDQTVKRSKKSTLDPETIGLEVEQ